MRARASALYCYYCTYFALLYLLPPAVVVVESSSPLLRRGRCFQTFVSPALDSTSCGPVVRPLPLLSNLSLPLAPIEGPRCKAARIVKPGTADFAHARSRVLARSVAMCVQARALTYRDTCRVEDRMDKSMFRGDERGRGTEEARHVMYTLMHRRGGWYIAASYYSHMKDGDDCRCRTRGCGVKGINGAG